MTLFLSLVLLLVLVVLFGVAVSKAYALPDRPRQIDIPTSDGWTIVAHHRPAATKRFSTPIVLCPGLANNHAFMDFRGDQNLARFLSDAGFDCYTLDLRGVGHSRPPDYGPWDVTVDDFVRYDLPAAIEAICRRAGSEKIVWVGHSLGGLVALAAASTDLKKRFAALVTVGSPTFFELSGTLLKLLRVGRALAPTGALDSTLLRFFAPLAGRFRAPALANTTANLNNLEPVSQRYLVANVFAPMWKGVLAQLEDWVRHNAFRSVDARTDYRPGIAQLEIPVLVMGGTADVLAPPEATRQLFELLTTPHRELALFGRVHGQEHDYGHGDLIVGRQAHREVYPVMLRFLSRYVGENPSLAPSVEKATVPAP